MNRDAAVLIIDIVTIWAIGILWLRIWWRMRTRTTRPDRLTSAFDYLFLVTGLIWIGSGSVLIVLRLYWPFGYEATRWLLRVAVWVALWRTNRAMTADDRLAREAGGIMSPNVDTSEGSE